MEITTPSGTSLEKILLQYEGFEIQNFDNAIVVAGDGSTEFSVYFVRKTFKIEVEYQNGDDKYIKSNVRYGTVLQDIGFNNNPKKKGYVFDGFYLTTGNTKIELSSTMPANELSLVARWGLGISSWILQTKTPNLQNAGGGIETNNQTIETQTLNKIKLFNKNL